MRSLTLAVALATCASGAASGAIQSVWTSVFDSARFDVPVALALDAQQNPVVLIDSSGEFSLLKYSPAGAALWTNRYDSPLTDVPTGLVIDSTGAICVSAVAATNNSPGALVLRKYAPDGALLWARFGDVTNAVPNNPGVPVSPVIATDAANNVLVAVCSPVAYTVLKYDPTGTPLWTNHYPIAAGCIASTKCFGTDAEGNAVLVAGLIRSGNDQVVVLRCSPSGVLTAGSHEWPGPVDFLAAAALDATGNVYLAASVQPAGQFAYHLFIARHGVDGTLAWSRMRAPAPGLHHAVAVGLVLDPTGDLLVTGYETYPDSQDDDVYQTLTLRYTPAGDLRWSARMQGFDRRPTGLAVGDGHVCVVSGDSFAQSTFLVTYRADGSQAAEKVVPGHSAGRIVAGSFGEFCVNFSDRATTRKFVLVESPSPLIATITPASAEVLPGTRVTFTAVVSGAGPFTYDWRYLGYRTGVTNATLTITNARYQWGSHGDYTVIVSNPFDQTISPEARLTVLQVPTVQITPGNQCAFVGQAATFRANASGTEPLSYSWLFNGRPVPGTTSNRLDFPAVAPADAGFYSVVASNRAGVSTSSVAKLQVVLPPKSFTNPAAIVIPTNGIASPYPSELVVTGVTGQIAKITATLRALTCSSPGDLAVLLQSPDGTGLVLLADDADESGPTAAITVTFDDDALEYVPEEILASGTFKPTRHPAPAFPTPALSTPRIHSFADFGGHELNGAWRLFVLDQYPWFMDGSPSQLAGGWQLDFLESEPAAVFSTRFHRITRIGNEIELVWDGFPGWRLQRSASLGAPQWTDVPGTLGASQALLPLGPSLQFFRLAK